MSSFAAPATPRPDLCPLCGSPNDCQLCGNSPYKGPCWCFGAVIPDALLALVPPELRGRQCICRGCVATYRREQSAN